MTQRIHGIIKIILTAGLAAVLLFIVHSEYRQVKDILPQEINFDNGSMTQTALENRANIKNLNYFKPAFGPLALLAQSKGSAEVSLTPYIDYYERVVRYFPSLAEGWGVLGYCYFYAGLTDQAVDALVKAAQLNPDFFWHSYNLGVIYFHQKAYRKMDACLRTALDADPKTTLASLYASPVYRQILAAGQLQDYLLQQNLYLGFQNCQKMFVATQYELRGRPVHLDETQVYVQLF